MTDSESNKEKDEDTFAETAIGRIERLFDGEQDDSSSRQVGPYKLLQQIGEGGMGTVWMAEQEQPVRRRVALKLIKAGMADKQVIARFEAERQALAMMDHQNIAKVLDAGTAEDGSPYFVMELVQGIPITEYCDRNKLTPNERLALFIPVCKAVQHAHQKGIIHRDLKPSNVLVCIHDGQPVAKVIDFGLAKALQHQTKLTDKTMFTEFGQVVGTVQYMSPEQAVLDALDVDTRSDIYSLGVMLYELLAGSTPLDEDTLKKNALLQILEIIREKDPPRPSHRLSSSGEQVQSISDQRQIAATKLQQILRGDLDWIVMKALEKDRTRRYETANDFAEDIQRYLDGEAIEARPPSASYRLRKFARKNRGLVASVTAIFALLVAGVTGTTGFAFKARDKERIAVQNEEAAKAERAKAIQQREKADEARNVASQKEQAARQLLKQVVRQHIDRANALVDQNRHADAANWVCEALKLEDAERGQEMHRIRLNCLLAQLPKTISVSKMQPSSFRATAYAVSPPVIRVSNGVLLPHASGLRIMRSELLRAQSDIVPISPFRISRQYAIAENGNRVLISPNKRSNDSVICYDISPLQLAWTNKKEQAFFKRFSRRTDNETQRFDLPISVSADGNACCVVRRLDTGDFVALVLDGSTGVERSRVDLEFACHVAALSPNGSLLFTASFDPKRSETASSTTPAFAIHLWNAETGQLIQQYSLESKVECIDFSNNGQRLAIGCDDGGVRVFRVNANEMNLACSFRQSGEIMRVRFDPTGDYLAVSGASRLVQVWDLTSCLECFQSTLQHGSEVSGLDFSPSGRLLASTGFDKSVGVWDVKTGTAFLQPIGIGEFGSAVEFLNDERLMVCSRTSYRCLELPPTAAPIESGQSRMQLRGLACNRDSISAITDRGFYRANAIGKSVNAVFELIRQSDIADCVICDDRSTAAIVDRNGKLLISSPLGTAPRLVHQSTWPQDYALSADGRFLAILEKSAADGVVRSFVVKRVSDGRTLLERPADRRDRSCSFSGNASEVWVFGDHQRIRGFTVEGKSVEFRSRKSRDVFDVEASPDGKWLAAGGTDGEDNSQANIFVWDRKNGSKAIMKFTHDGGINDLEFSPCGRFLAAADWYGKARIWDVRSQRAVTPSLDHDEHVRKVSFDPTGTFLATLGDDGKARLWDASNGDRIAMWSLPNAHIKRACFNYNGTSIALASADGTISVKDLRPLEGSFEELQETVCLRTFQQPSEYGTWEDLKFEDWYKKWRRREVAQFLEMQSENSTTNETQHEGDPRR